MTNSELHEQLNHAELFQKVAMKKLETATGGRWGKSAIATFTIEEVLALTQIVNDCQVRIDYLKKHLQPKDE